MARQVVSSRQEALFLGKDSLMRLGPGRVDLTEEGLALA
jgi:hypothetical protein